VRELNSQSATNQAAALPLSYPAEKRHFNRCEHAMRASRLPFQRFVDGSEDLPRKNCPLERVALLTPAGIAIKRILDVDTSIAPVRRSNSGALHAARQPMW
jgi:hypothetical protein